MHLTTFFALLQVEAIKLRRSLAGVLVLVAPALIAVFVFLNSQRSEQVRTWDQWLTGSAFMWATFMLPMTVTALVALLAQTEHAPRSWDYLRALPLPRWQLFAVKGIVVVVLSLVMALLVPVFSVLALLAANGLGDVLADGDQLAVAGVASTFIRIAVAGLLLVSIQFWLALRYASFVPCLVVGIGGTFFAIAAYGAPEGVYFPWLMPLNVLASDPAANRLALLLGGGLGSVAMVAACSALARRESMGPN